MPNPSRPRPTEAELAILQILWRRGPSTVREVHDELAEQRPVGYTTVLKLMQIMAEKGLATRDESQRTHVYAANCSQDRTQAQLVRDLLQRAFAGSAHALVMQALSTAKVSNAELSDIRRLLDKLGEDKR